MVLLLVVEATELVDVAEVVEVPSVARKAANECSDSYQTDSGNHSHFRDSGPRGKGTYSSMQVPS